MAAFVRAYYDGKLDPGRVNQKSRPRDAGADAVLRRRHRTGVRKAARENPATGFALRLADEAD